VIVESVDPGRAAARAGVRAGDLLLAWYRAPAPPANPEPAEGTFNDPVDVTETELEQAPRGPVTLQLRRSDHQLDATLLPGDWGLTVRPVLAPEQERQYLSATRLLEENHVTEAARVLEELAGEAQGRGHDQLAAWLLSRAAVRIAERGQPEHAQRLFDEALAAAQGSESEPWVLARLGRSQLQREMLAEAAASSRRCLAIRAERSPGSLQYATALTNLATCVKWLDQFAEAGQLLQQGLAIQERLAPHSLAVAETLTRIAMLSELQGDLTAAEHWYRQAMSLTEEVAPDSFELAEAAESLGLLLHERGESAAALPLCERAVQLTAKLVPDSPELAQKYANLGLVLADSDRAQGQEDLTRALTILEREEPLSARTARVLNDIGVSAAKRGDLEKAQEMFSRLLEVVEATSPDSTYAAGTANNLGAVCLERGELTRAEEHFSRALALFERRGAAGYIAIPVNNLGIVAERRQDWEAARQWYDRALALRLQAAPDSLEVAAAYSAMATLARGQGHLEEALEYHRRDLAITKEKAPHSLAWARSNHELGTTLAEQGKLAEAEQHLRRALAVRTLLAPGSSFEAETLHELGMTLARRDRNDEALALFEQAIDSLEQQISRLGSSNEEQAAYRARFRQYYTDLIELLLERGRQRDAFAMLERSRARALLLMMAERDLVFARDIPVELDRERRSVDDEYERIFANLATLASTETERIAEQRQRLEELRAHRADLERRIRHTCPALADLTFPEPVGVEQAQGMLDPGTVVLSYCATRRQTILFVLTMQSFEVTVIPLTSEELTGQVELFRGLIEGRADEELIRRTGVRLYQQLLAPASRRITAARRLVVVPDGGLHLLPFAALSRNGSGGLHYLAEDIPVSSEVSLTVLQQLRRRSPATSSRVVVFADPAYSQRPHGRESMLLRNQALTPLPASRTEAMAIGRLYERQATLWLGKEATEARAKAVGSARILHFATHVLLDEQHPLDSCIALATPAEDDQDNGFLAAWEVLESLRVDADLVTLSGCQTALGAAVAGEGLIGLTRAFEYAGARSVLASLWQVEDRRTAALMQRFHAHLHAGLSRDQALQRAQAELIAGPVELEEQPEGPFAWLGSLLGPRRATVDATHPFFWAAFTLQGEWR